MEIKTTSIIVRGSKRDPYMKLQSDSLSRELGII